MKIFLKCTGIEGMFTNDQLAIFQTEDMSAVLSIVVRDGEPEFKVGEGWRARV